MISCKLLAGFAGFLRAAIIVLAVSFPVPASSADLGRTLCQQEPREKSHIDLCKHLLIGVIDALDGLGLYCPDGNTSYAFLMDAWRRDLARNPERKESPTARSMLLTTQSLGLACRRK